MFKIMMFKYGMSLEEITDILRSILCLRCVNVGYVMNKNFLALEMWVRLGAIDSYREVSSNGSLVEIVFSDMFMSDLSVSCAMIPHSLKFTDAVC